MGRDQDSGQFEWVNAWAESRPEPLAVPVTAEAPKPIAPAMADTPKPVMAKIAPALPEDQLMRDIAEIERVRDALDAEQLAGSFSAKKRMQALTLVPSRTTDPVPVVIGGVLALVMLTVFGAAAAMSKMAR